MTLHEKRENECWEISGCCEGVQSALWAIAAGLFAVSSAQAYAARHLGNGNAMTDMGAIEAFSKHLGERLDHLADVISDK